MDRIFDRRDVLSGIGISTLVVSTGSLSAFAAEPKITPSTTSSGSTMSGTWVKADADVDFIILSGNSPTDLYHRHPHIPSEMLLPEDVEAQTHLAMRRINEILQYPGLSWRNIVRVMRYQTDMADNPAIERVMKMYFGDWKPATSIMECRTLRASNAKLELEMIAVAPRKKLNDE